MECVTNCEFMNFTDNIFTCTYCNNTKLKSIKIINDKGIKVYRCKECIEDGSIGTGTTQENARKLKKHLGWMADDFYSFKDTFEQSLSELYKIVKSMEEQ